MSSRTARSKKTFRPMFDGLRALKMYLKLTSHVHTFLLLSSTATTRHRVTIIARRDNETDVMTKDIHHAQSRQGRLRLKQRLAAKLLYCRSDAMINSAGSLPGRIGGVHEGCQGWQTKMAIGVRARRNDSRHALVRFCLTCKAVPQTRLLDACVVGMAARSGPGGSANQTAQQDKDIHLRRLQVRVGMGVQCRIWNLLSAGPHHT